MLHASRTVKMCDTLQYMMYKDFKTGAVDPLLVYCARWGVASGVSSMILPYLQHFDGMYLPCFKETQYMYAAPTTLTPS